MSQELKEKVQTLEETMQDFIRHTERAFSKLSISMTDLKNSMDDFREEMQEYRVTSAKEMQEYRDASAKEMQAYRDTSAKKMQEYRDASAKEMQAYRDASAKEMQEYRDTSAKEMQEYRDTSAKEMQQFKAEMTASRDASAKEMQAFKAEMAASRDASAKEMQEFKETMAKKWGELANRLGTLAEDVVAPNVVPLAHKYFNCSGPPLDFMVRRKKIHSKDRGWNREFDAHAVFEDTVILTETKATPRVEYLDNFAQAIEQFYQFFPEYAGKKLIPIFASLYVDESIVKYATRKNIYVMALKGDSMDILNLDKITK